jgi:hypothetical protein
MMSSVTLNRWRSTLKPMVMITGLWTLAERFEDRTPATQHRRPSETNRRRELRTDRGNRSADEDVGHLEHQLVVGRSVTARRKKAAELVHLFLVKDGVASPRRSPVKACCTKRDVSAHPDRC